jgi:excisionase family DNA binding protein
VSIVPFPAGHGAGHGDAGAREKPRVPKGALHEKSGALLTFQAVAEHCAVSVWTVRTWVDTGKLPVLRLPGRLVRIRPADLAAFLEACR